MTNSEIRDFLEAHADARYAAFSASLVPGAQRLLGVRLPVLRALARDIAKEDWRTYLDGAADDSFEETMLQGLVTGGGAHALRGTAGARGSLRAQIDNWSLCDSPATGFKFVRKHREEAWQFLQPYLHGDDEFAQRFAWVMLLAHFVTEEFIGRVLDACTAVPLRASTP